MVLHLQSTVIQYKLSLTFWNQLSSNKPHVYLFNNMFIFKHVRNQRYKQQERQEQTSHCDLLSNGRDMGSKEVAGHKSVIWRLRQLLGTLLNYPENSESPSAKVASSLSPHTTTYFSPISYLDLEASPSFHFHCPR